MKLLGLPTTKHFFSFILGCLQDFNFAQPFWYGWVEIGLNGRNSRAKWKSCGHPRIKLKKMFCMSLRRSKSFIENCHKKNRFIIDCTVFPIFSPLCYCNIFYPLDRKKVHLRPTNANKKYTSKNKFSNLQCLNHSSDISY